MLSEYILLACILFVAVSAFPLEGRDGGSSGGSGVGLGGNDGGPGQIFDFLGEAIIEFFSLGR